MATRVSKSTEDAPGEEKGFYQRLNALREELGNISKNKKNDHFKSSYADITAVLEHITEAMNKHDIAFTQTTELVSHTVNENEEGTKFVPGYNYAFMTTTKLIDAKNGQVMEKMFYPIVSKDYNDAQKVGSGQTYARRYSLLTILGLSADDDDGNSASTSPKTTSTMPSKTRLVKDVQTKYNIRDADDLAKTTELHLNKKVSSFNDLDFDDLNKLLEGGTKGDGAAF